jgi:ribosomal protein L16 Arg81 hydroxylase
MTYSVQKGRVGRHYCKYLTLLWQGVRKRKWNSERPLMFAKLILQTTPDVKKSKDVRSRLDLRMELWERGRIRARINDVFTPTGASREG